MAKQAQGFIPGREAWTTLGEMVEWWKTTRRSRGPLNAEPFTKFGPRVVRFARLETNSRCSFPALPADTFPCVFGELTFNDASCGLNGHTFTAYTPAEDRVCHDYTAATHSSGDIVPIVLHHGKWFILPAGDEIQPCKLTQCLYPGETAAGVRMEYNAATNLWVATADVVTVSDPFCWNMGIPNEIVWCCRNADDVWDVIGSHGLVRKGKADADIACGQSGNVTIHSDITSASCNSTASNCTVIACNTWGEVRKVKQDEEVMISYFGTRPVATEVGRRWMIIPSYFPRWVNAQLSAELCPGDTTASITGASVYVDGCPSVSISTADNLYNLAGPAGAEVLLLRRENDTWILVQIEHSSGYFAYDIGVALTSGEQGCSLAVTLYRERISYMGCFELDTVDDSEALDTAMVVTGWSISHSEGSQSGSGDPYAGECNLTITKKSVCVFDGPVADEVTIIPLTPKIILQDVTINGVCFDGQVFVGYFFCADATDTVQLICGTTCGSGSGSQ